MLGRFELARDIMANLMLQNQNAIIRSERNRVGQSFLELIRNEPNHDIRLRSNCAQAYDPCPAKWRCPHPR